VGYWYHKLDEMIKLGIIALPVEERLAPLRKVFEDFLFNKYER